MINIKELINKYLSGGKKTDVDSYVGITITLSSKLEIVKFDTKTQQVIANKKADISYDFITKQINDIDSFETAIQSFFVENDLATDTPIVISLPAVTTEFAQYPLDLSNFELKEALISESEKNYIFKKTEPTVSFVKIASDKENETQKVVFSSIQVDQIEATKSIFKELKLNLEAIDSTLISLVRGLEATGQISEDLEKNFEWVIFLVAPNSYVIMSFKGHELTGISENAFAIKSFNPEDIYPAMATYFLEGLENKNPDHIILISKTNNISADVLSSYFDMNSKVSFIEENKFAKTLLFPEKIDLFKNTKKSDNEGENFVSLEGVGTTLWNKTKMKLNLNFLEKDEAFSDTISSGKEITILNKKINVSSKLIEVALIGMIAISFVSISILYIILGSFANGTAKNIEEMKKQITDLQSVEAQLKSKTDAEVKLFNYVFGIYQKNKTFLHSYDVIGKNIPEKLWLDELKLTGEYGVSITGKAYSVEDIVNYFRALSKNAKFSNFKIESIKVTDENNSGQTEDISQNLSNSLPNLPDLSLMKSLTAKKFYEFSFGGDINNSPTTGGTPPPTGSTSPPVTPPSILQQIPGLQNNPSAPATPTTPAAPTVPGAENNPNNV